MNAKDLMQMNEQILAFNTLMKGELQAEIAQAKAAVEAAGGANAIVSGQTSLAADKASFEAYKESIESILEESKQEARAKEDDLTSRENILKSNEQTLSDDLTALLAEKQQFQVDLVAASTQAALDRTALVKAQSYLDEQRVDLDTAFAGIAQRENEVARKLAAMKAIA